MSYRLSNNEAVSDGIRRIVREEISLAAGRLESTRPADRDQAIHEARKSVKKIRGVLRLVEPQLGAAYDSEVELWRNLGRKLSRFRDAAAIVEALDGIRKNNPGDLPARAVGTIRKALVTQKHEIEKGGAIGSSIVPALRDVSAALKRAQKRLAKWPLSAGGFAGLAPGLKLTYRRGAKALRKAGKDPTVDKLHRFRKTVKEHVYQLRLLEGLWDKALKRREARLGKLEELLGDHHNLAVLRERIFEQPKIYGSPAEVELFLDFVDRNAERLCKRALKAGAKAYKEPPARFTRTMEKRWGAWTNPEKPVGLPRTSYLY